MLSEFQFLLLLCDIQTAQSSSNRRYHRRIFNILHPHLHTRRLSLHHIRNTTNAVSTRIQTLTNRAQQHTQPFVLKDQIVRTNTKTLRITPTRIPNPASTVHIVLIFPRRRYSFLHSKQPHLTHLEIVIVTVCRWQGQALCPEHIRSVSQSVRTLSSVFPTVCRSLCRTQKRAQHASSRPAPPSMLSCRSS